MLGSWRDLYMLEKLAAVRGGEQGAGSHWAQIAGLISASRQQLWAEARQLCRDTLPA